MSEFARQAHPDHAHIERLAKEIPGMTPENVRLWFQEKFVKRQLIRLFLPPLGVLLT
jgi:hypothetical protein